MTKEDFNKILESEFFDTYDKNMEYSTEEIQEAIEQLNNEAGNVNINELVAAVYSCAVRAGAHIGVYAAMGILCKAGFLKFDD